MKTIIVDDERLARLELKGLLEQFPEIELIGEASHVDEALTLINEFMPDLLFLDIQMPAKSGFDLLKALDNYPQVIFTTAHDDYAIRAFEVNAMDYLLKPIHPDRLAAAIKRLKQHTRQPKDEDNEQETIPTTNLTIDDQVFVKDGSKCWFVELNKVRLFESDGNYVKVFFENEHPLIHRSLNALDERLDQRHFFRANRKHIINLHHISKMESWYNGGLLIVLSGGEKIEVSRRQARKFKEIKSI